MMCTKRLAWKQAEVSWKLFVAIRSLGASVWCNSTLHPTLMDQNQHLLLTFVTTPLILLITGDFTEHIMLTILNIISTTFSRKLVNDKSVPRKNMRRHCKSKLVFNSPTLSVINSSKPNGTWSNFEIYTTMPTYTMEKSAWHQYYLWYYCHPYKRRIWCYACWQMPKILFQSSHLHWDLERER